jgi:DNA-binding response OmpR family regulator
MSESSASRVLIVEDDAVVAETLTTYLEHAGFAVVAAADGPSGLARAQQPDVALVILDWMVPGMSGPEVCRRLRSASSVPVLMLTARTSEDDRLHGFDTGADDYVGKPFSPREVVARVQALLRRSGRTPSAAPATRPPTVVGPLEIDHFRREVRVEGRVVAVTPTELRLLEALASHPGRTFTRDELVARAFGPDYEGLDRTVDVHVTNLRRKLDQATRASTSSDVGQGFSPARLIQTVHGLGYRLVERE